MRLTKEEATNFFSLLYGGEHHIPGREPKEFGLGWYIMHDRGDLATWDYDQLTKLVLLAHDKCIRASVEARAPGKLRIAIWKRQREGRMFERHPTIETAIENFNKAYHEQ